jgi:uncharacterized protein DUF4386
MDAREARYRRVWARIAGLMFWLVFVFDFSGMLLHGKPQAHWLSLIGGLLTLPLAYGLYVAVAPLAKTVAMAAFAFRFGEIALTLMSVLASFPAIRVAWSGTPALALVKWERSTSFSAFLFTIGSTLFFLIFLRSRAIPLALSLLGVFASVLAFGACFAHLVRPEFPALAMAAWIPMILAELLTGVWLLMRPVRYAAALSPARAVI